MLLVRQRRFWLHFTHTSDEASGYAPVEMFFESSAGSRQTVLWRIRLSVLNKLFRVTSMSDPAHLIGTDYCYLNFFWLILRPLCVLDTKATCRAETRSQINWLWRWYAGTDAKDKNDIAVEITNRKFLVLGLWHMFIENGCLISDRR